MSHKNLIFSNLELKNSLNYLMEVNDVESDISDLTDRLEGLDDLVTDDIERMGYVRQLTAEFLELFMKLTKELEKANIEIPETSELMNKVLGRADRKRYYMSKFRL